MNNQLPLYFLLSMGNKWRVESRDAFDGKNYSDAKEFMNKAYGVLLVIEEYRDNGGELNDVENDSFLALQDQLTRLWGDIDAVEMEATG